MEKSNSPRIRFKGFTEPWEQRKLGEITYQSGEKNVDDLPYESYSVSNTEGFINQKEQFKYGGLVSVADKSKSIIVTPHTFAYNPARIDIGSIGYQNLDKNVIISPMYEIFKAKNEFLDDRFLWHWLKSDIFNRIVVNNQEGGVRTCFNLPKFFEACITIPKSVKEQRLIGIFFDSIDQFITLHQRKCERLEKVKQGLLEKMFPAEKEDAPKIRFKGFAEPWEQRKLCTLIVDGGSGGTPSTSNPNYYNGTIPFLSITDISKSDGYIFDTEKHINNEGLRSSAAWIVPAESISLAMYASVGKVAILKENTATSQAFYNLVFDNSTTRNIVFQILKKKEINNEWMPVISTGTQANLNAEKVRETVVAIPINIEEQKKISSLLFKLDSLITLHQRKCEKLKNIKSALLERMFV